MQFHEDGNRTFVESPAGTICFTTTVVPSPDYAARFPPDSDDESEYGGQAADIFSDVVVRSHDQGRTVNTTTCKRLCALGCVAHTDGAVLQITQWGDLTPICPRDNPHESNLAVDPQNDRHLFAMTRCQRGLLAGESETVSSIQTTLAVWARLKEALPTGVRGVRQPHRHGHQEWRSVRVVGCR